MDYSIKNLSTVEDSAPKFGFSDSQEARFAREDLGAEKTGLSYHVVKAGQRQAFGHKHEQAEEIYVVLSGTGRLRLDDDIVDVKPMDAIRVAPQVLRSFEAGSEALQLLAFGEHFKDDGELVFDFWKD
jgi:uncharacterized cupin superfamily protein